MVATPEGKLLARIPTPATHNPNLALTPDCRRIVIAGVFDGPNNTYRGAVHEVANPLAGH